MKQGKLSIQEKYAIQGMIHDKKELSEIANTLDRSETLVKKYVDEELSSLIETISKSKVQQSTTKNKKITGKDLYARLEKDGEVLATIMTSASSQKGDKTSEQHRKRAKINKFLSKGVVRLSDGKVLEHGDFVQDIKTGPFSDEEINKIIELIKQNKSTQHIASRLNRNENEVAKVVNSIKMDEYE